MGASMPFDEIDTTNQANRRIVIMVLNEIAEQNLREGTLESERDGITPPDEAQPIGPIPEIF
jgi:hypothetical protein